MRCALPWLLALSLLSTAARADYQNEILPILEEYCFDCHGDGSKKGDFSMDKFSNLAAHVQDQEHWLSIWRNVRSQIMPPSEKTQLPYSDKIKLLAWIERKVLKLDSDNPDPGRVTIRRLNREEYKNAIFDLLGVEFDTAESFPPDDTGYGFDNIGDVLSISPILMEKYLTAAEEIVHQALPKGAAAQVPRFDLPGENLQAPGDPKTTGRWLPFAEQNQIRIQHEIQWDGDYRVELEFSIQGAMEATDHAADLEFFAGGQSVNSERLGWDHRRVIRLSGEAHLMKGLQVFEVKLLSQSSPVRGGRGTRPRPASRHRARPSRR